MLVDTGDLHDGTGISDGFPPGGIDGQQSSQLLATLPYDVLAIGNHELYIYNITKDMHDNLAPRFPGRYLSSNVNITINNVSEPVGERFAKFNTTKGRKVTALGVLFHFTGNDEGTTVQDIPPMVNETWVCPCRILCNIKPTLTASSLPKQLKRNLTSFCSLGQYIISGLTARLC